MSDILFCNGSFAASDEATIPAYDRGLFFGEGVFTTMRVEDGIVEFFDLHLARLAKQGRQMQIAIPQIHSDWVQELIVRNQALEGIWRLKIMVTAGREPADQEGSLREAGSLLMTLERYKPCKPPLELGMSKYPVIRPSAQLKSLAYYDRMLLRREAEELEVDDVITTLADGTLLEASSSNLFWVSRNTLFTPDASLPILSGILLEQVVANANTLHLGVKQVRSTIEQVPNSAHLFCCNSLSHVVPVIQVGGRKFSRDRRLEDEIAIALRSSIERNSLDCSWQTA